MTRSSAPYKYVHIDKNEAQDLWFNKSSVVFQYLRYPTLAKDKEEGKLNFLFASSEYTNTLSFMGVDGLPSLYW